MIGVHPLRRGQAAVRGPDRLGVRRLIAIVTTLAFERVELPLEVVEPFIRRGQVRPVKALIGSTL